MHNELVLYQSDELPERIEVKIDEETVWLNRQQISVLFGRDVKTIAAIRIWPNVDVGS